MLAAGTCSAASDTLPYEIDAVLSLTGSGAFGGKLNAETMGMVETATNATGGIAGRPLKITVLDDQTNPRVALQLANQLIANHATVILGPTFTAQCSAVQVLLAAGPVDYCTAPGVHPAPGSFMFSANPGTDSIVATEIRFARERGWKRVAFLMSTDATGQDLAEQYDAALGTAENKGVQAVAREVFNPTDISVGAQLAKIKSAQAQVLFTGVSGTAFGTVLHGMAEAGLDIPVVAPTSDMHVDQMLQYKAILPSQVLFGGNRGAAVEPNAEARVKQAQAAFFAACQRAGYPVDGHPQMWDATWIVVDALRHVGTNATPAQLRDYIDGLQNWVGIDGPYDFRRIPQRGIGAEGTIMYAWDATKSQLVLASKPQGRL